jgi:hypothetical protein
MRRNSIGVLAVVACAACLVIPGAAVADTLDQQQPAGGSDVRIQSNESLAQTFTAGLTGGLDRLELLLGAPDSAPDAPLTVEIRPVSGGSPGTTSLASGSVPTSAVSSTDAWVPITFATAAPVTAGTQYAIVAYSPVDSSHDYFWAIAFPDPYPAGATFYQTVSPPGPTWTLAALGGDQAFKTYVDVPSSGATPGPTGPTGRRAAAKRKCKKKFDKGTTKRRKCLKKARKLPV